MNKNPTVWYRIWFVLYLSILIYFLFFAEGFRENVTQTYHYNLIPFTEIRRYIVYHKQIGMTRVLINLLGNIVAFMPFGYILPCMGKRPLSFWAVTLLSLDFSIAVELVQLFTRVGCCDVDDVLLNTVGGMLGYLCYWLWKGRQTNESKMEKI